MDIVLFFQSAKDKSWRDKLAGVYRFAREHDWFIQVVDHDASPRDIRRTLEKWKPIGCLVDRARASTAAPDKVFRRIPAVYHDQDPRHPSCAHPNLLHDSAASARMAGNELLCLDLPVYAYAPRRERLFWCRERCVAFRRLVRERGKRFIELDPEDLIGSIAALPSGCGILASDDAVAFNVCQAAKAAGRVIPDDFALASIDNDEMLCEAVTPGITSVQPDFEGAGYHLAEMLAAEISAFAAGRPRKPRTEVYLPLRIVRRGSTRLLPKTDPRVSRALEYLRRNVSNSSLRTDDVVKIMKCSRRLATLRFREMTGHSIGDEILGLRLSEARRLLAETGLPISEIVMRCGYGSGSFMKRRFKEATGLSMRDWRARASKSAVQPARTSSHVASKLPVYHGSATSRTLPVNSSSFLTLPRSSGYTRWRRSAML